MNKHRLFALYKRVQAKEPEARQSLVVEHRRVYGRSNLYLEADPKTNNEYMAVLHTMYLNLCI